MSQAPPKGGPGGPDLPDLPDLSDLPDPLTPPRSADELLAGLPPVRSAPTGVGTLDLIVQRPEVHARVLPTAAGLDAEQGLVGDSWKARGSRHTPDGAADPERQLTIMSSRAIALFTALALDEPGAADAWAQAGDQLIVDLDLSETNLPAGTRLRIGGAVVEVTEKPHTGCAKFTRRFGLDATRFLRHEDAAPLRLRGINARVVLDGTIATGDTVTKL